MRNTIAVFKNQINELLADKEQLLIFIIFPVLGFFQTRMVELDEGVYPYQIVLAVASMFASSVMIMALPQIIAEHRENGSLRFMVMSGIKPTSYLVGVGGFFLVLNILVAGFFAWLGELQGEALWRFLLAFLLAVTCAILVGMVLGVLSKNRQKAISLAMPIGMGIMLLPMFVEIIEPLQPVLEILYIDRVANMMQEIKTGIPLTDMYVVLVNIAVLLLVFAVLFKKKGMKA